MNQATEGRDLSTDNPKPKKPKNKKSTPDTPSPAPDKPSASATPAPQPTPLLPYPVPPYAVMNPAGYPPNGTPYPQHPSYHQPPPGAQPHPGSIPPTQYAYAVHHSPYPPHPGYGYAPPYPQPQGMMAYAPNRAESHELGSPGDTSPTASGSASAGAKRKRKSGEPRKGDKNSEDEDVKKRTKTQRACDSCRSRKIRCDVLGESDPPVCQHCKQYGFDCTFFLPITETRFKKKRLEEEAAAAAEKERDDRRTSSPRDRGAGEVRFLGPTSPAHLLHSQAGLSSRIYESYDTRYHHKWEVTSAGEGLIQIHDPATPEEQQPPIPKPLDLKIQRDVIEKLINAYFNEVAPNLPVITRTEFLANPQPPPVLLYSMCLVAAARREVPQSVFDSIRYAVNNLIKGEEVLSTPSIVNLQALLVLCMLADCHSAHVPQALSGLWIRLGAAIRMAQDLGLHRAESVKQNVELRRRLWGVCVIADRWTSLAYGHPYMIDVSDCDARLPSSGDPEAVYMDELMRLSILLGRVLKTIYSPSGLMFATDEILNGLLGDIESWKANLPASLQYRGVEGPRQAGLLHLVYSCVLMIFWRVFMRISYSCPEHLKFGLTIEHWTKLLSLTGEAIDWLDRHEQMYDVWLLVAYASTSCALVQYHTWARRKDPQAAAKLRQLRDCVRRWESSLSPDHMSSRRKTAEIITLLYEATQGPPMIVETPALNPTGGVQGKPNPALTFKKDPSRPGGGVYVAHGPAKKGDFSDVPAGVVIPASDDEEGEDEQDQGSNTGITGSGSSIATRAPDAGASSSFVNLTPLGGGLGIPNVNPAMNAGEGPMSVQVMNVLDGSNGNTSLEQFAMMDTGLLEGLPGGMFDWGQWDTFFSRFTGPPGTEGQQLQTFPPQPTPDGSSRSPPNMLRHGPPDGTR